MMGRERMREIDEMLFPETVWQDLRFGARVLLRKAGFTAVAVFFRVSPDPAIFTFFFLVSGGAG